MAWKVSSQLLFLHMLSVFIAKNKKVKRAQVDTFGKWETVGGEIFWGWRQMYRPHSPTMTWWDYSKVNTAKPGRPRTSKASSISRAGDWSGFSACTLTNT